MVKPMLAFLSALALARPAPAVEGTQLEQWLKQPVLAKNVSLTEVQAFTENRVPPMPSVTSADEWKRLAKQLRADVLDRVVFRGAAKKWRRGKVRVEWLETIAGGPGYRIKKLRYEAVPGFWIPALLYEPVKLSGRVPAVLNVNGHDPQGKAADYKQIRCINQARRGMLALNPEWIGMGQLRGPGYSHATMNQLDLCGTSGLAVFYLAMSRALDVLVAHPNTDPDRVAVAGLSGGGWQTIFISALDLRVQLCNPVAGYSSFRTRARFLEDLGDSEQTPCDLATVADYTHLTALLAPRSALLTFNAQDNCCFASGHALQPLLEAAAPIYKLLGQATALRWHVNHEPGTHNFGADNRAALYRMLGDHFFTNQFFDPLEMDCATEIKSNAVLEVKLPANNATFQSLALALSRDLPRTARPPAAREAAARWRKEHRETLRAVVRARHALAIAERVRQLSTNDLHLTRWRLTVDDTWSVPVVELAGANPQITVMLLADQGRASLAAPARQWLEGGARVLAVDPFYFGESGIPQRGYLFALLVAAVGDRPLGIQAGQVAAIARWARQKYGPRPVELVARGPRSSTMALVAAGLEPQAIGGLHLHEALGSLKQVIEQNGNVTQMPELFCFGLLDQFDIPQLTALVAPRPVVFHQSSARVRQELQPWAELTAGWGGNLEFR